jgi:hypothetical protein
MREGRSKRGIAAALVGLVALLGVATLTPAGAGALDSDLKHAFAFRLEASNGYSVVAFASSQRADGRGEIVLLVDRRNASAIYAAPATLTATRIDADLGSLGEVSLDVVPTGRKRTVGRACGEGPPETVSFEAQSYRGNFEFHGEEGFTEAASISPPEYTRFFLDLLCGGGGGGELSGAMLPGARLRLHSHRSAFRLALQANKNRPSARTRFEVETKEERQGIFISRSRALWLGADAFSYDPLLRTATLAPPVPFSGHATFHRAVAAANRWAGNLTIDLPGRSKVPLAGGGIEATLSHACRHEGEGRFRC